MVWGQGTHVGFVGAPSVPVAAGRAVGLGPQEHGEESQKHGEGPHGHRGGQGEQPWVLQQQGSCRASPQPRPRGRKEPGGDKAGDLRLLADPDSQGCLASISL